MWKKLKNFCSVIKNVVPPFLKVPSKGAADFVAAFLPEHLEQAPLSEQQSFYLDLVLSLQADKGVEWWQMYTLLNPLETKEVHGAYERTRDYMVLAAFADKVFPATFNWITGGGVVSLYASIVFLASRFVRMMVTGGMHRIMFEELPSADRILQLCHDIFLVREAGELELEEDLYAKLIFLYRSPATLIKWTRKKNY